MRPTGLPPQAASCRADRRGGESEQGPRRPVSWLLRQIVVFIPVLVLDPLPGQCLKLFPGPGAIVVLDLLEALVFVNAEQDERLLGPGMHNPRRRAFWVFQRLHLLFG